MDHKLGVSELQLYLMISPLWENTYILGPGIQIK